MDLQFDLLYMAFLPDSEDVDAAVIPSGDTNGRPHDVRKQIVMVAEPRHPASTSHLEPVRRRAFSIAHLFDASVTSVSH